MTNSDTMAADTLKRLGNEASVTSFRRDGQIFHVVVAQTDPDDLITHHAVHPDQPAQREPYQRANIVLAIDRDLARALWLAEHQPLPNQGMHLTLWFEQSSSRYDIGPCAPRHGACGRPEWAPAPSDSDLWQPGDAL